MTTIVVLPPAATSIDARNAAIGRSAEWMRMSGSVRRNTDGLYSDGPEKLAAVGLDLVRGGDIATNAGPERKVFRGFSKYTALECTSRRILSGPGGSAGPQARSENTARFETGEPIRLRFGSSEGTRRSDRPAARTRQARSKTRSRLVRKVAEPSTPNSPG